VDPAFALGAATCDRRPAPPIATQLNVVTTSGTLGRLWKNGTRRVRIGKIDGDRDRLACESLP
jgi:hypothetical protein